MSWLPAAISAVGGLIDTGLSFASAKYQSKLQKQYFDYTNQKNLENIPKIAGLEAAGLKNAGISRAGMTGSSQSVTGDSGSIAAPTSNMSGSIDRYLAFNQQKLQKELNESSIAANNASASQAKSIASYNDSKKTEQDLINVRLAEKLGIDIDTMNESLRGLKIENDNKDLLFKSEIRKNNAAAVVDEKTSTKIIDKMIAEINKLESGNALDKASASQARAAAKNLTEQTKGVQIDNKYKESFNKLSLQEKHKTIRSMDLALKKAAKENDILECKRICALHGIFPDANWINNLMTVISSASVDTQDYLMSLFD